MIPTSTTKCFFDKYQWTTSHHYPRALRFVKIFQLVEMQFAYCLCIYNGLEFWKLNFKHWS